MRECKVPGIKARHAIITPVCREGRGVLGAFKEAAKLMEEEYMACMEYICNEQVSFHLVITVDRETDNTR